MEYANDSLNTRRVGLAPEQPWDSETSLAAVSDDVDTLVRQPRFLTKQESVAEVIRNEILAGILSPGDELHQDEIAARLNVSSTPVREALRVLEAEGFLQHRPHHSPIVSLPDITALTDIYEIRALLEVFAAKKLIARNDEPALAQLERVVRESARALERNEIQKFVRSNADFHQILIRGAGSEALVEIMRKLVPRSLFFVALPQHRMVRAHHEHTRLVEALKARDLTRATELIEEHMAENAEALRRLIASRQQPVAGARAAGG